MTLQDLFVQQLTLAEFKDGFTKLYPGVLFVDPTMITTMEMRGDNSRFYPELDEVGNVTGGDFR